MSSGADDACMSITWHHQRRFLKTSHTFSPTGDTLELRRQGKYAHSKWRKGH